MKESIIRQIFYGKKIDYETIKQTKEFSKLQDEFAVCENDLINKLTPELLELYNKAIEANDNMFREAACTYYKEGFKFGLRIGLETAEKDIEERFFD